MSIDPTIDVRAMTAHDVPLLGALLSTERAAASCWCMWFIIAVKDYHRNGAAGNEAGFRRLAAGSTHPMGLLAFAEGDAVGWAALGPRSRYVRAAKTPTMREADAGENEQVWLLPCFFIRPDMRRRGVARQLVTTAVETAAGALAIEGFPTVGSKLAGADRQVGTESLFASCGFHVVSRPSSNRVVMRRHIGRT